MFSFHFLLELDSSSPAFSLEYLQLQHPITMASMRQSAQIPIVIRPGIIFRLRVNVSIWLRNLGILGSEQGDNNTSGLILD